MNILWIPQISCQSSAGEVLLEKDSNITFLKKLLNTELFTKNNVFIAFEFEGKEVIAFKKEIEDKYDNVKILSDRGKFRGAFYERFNFDFDFYEKIKNFYSIDVVFINEPTKALPLNFIFSQSLIVSYIHWLAYNNMPYLVDNQIGGIKASDLIFVNSRYVKNLIFKEGDLNKELRRMHVFYPPCNEFEEYKGKMSNNIIYNHRLSSDKYYMKAFRSLLKVCDLLEEEIGVVNMPTIYFTNPSGKDASGFIKQKPYFELKEFDTEKAYKNFLKYNVGIHLNTFFDSKGMWCSSTTDCIENCVIPLLPNKYGYREILNESYEGYCCNEEDMACVLKKCLNLGKEDREKLIEDVQRYASHLEAKEIGAEANSLISKELKIKREVCHNVR